MTDLEQRYGRRAPARPGAQGRWIGALAALLTLGVVGFWILSQLFGGVATQSIRADTLRFSPQGDRAISIQFAVTAPPGTPLACAIEAQNERHAVVGWDVVDVPASEQASQQVDRTIATVGEATSIAVKECWQVQPPAV